MGDDDSKSTETPQEEKHQDPLPSISAVPLATAQPSAPLDEQEKEEEKLVQSDDQGAINIKNRSGGKAKNYPIKPMDLLSAENFPKLEQALERVQGHIEAKTEGRHSLSELKKRDDGTYTATFTKPIKQSDAEKTEKLPGSRQANEEQKVELTFHKDKVKFNQFDADAFRAGVKILIEACENKQELKITGFSDEDRKKATAIAKEEREIYVQEHTQTVQSGQQKAPEEKNDAQTIEPP